MNYFRWAVIDIMTTGLNIKYDKITEISVLIITENGVEQAWHRLLDFKNSPAKLERKIENETEKFTYSKFIDIAEELVTVLQGSVLVAHNARFDFGFLKNAFKQVGITYQTNILCTIKLFRILYPSLQNLSLNDLAIEFGIKIKNEFSAKNNLDILHQILQHAFTKNSIEKILSSAKIIYKCSSLPSKLNTDINSFPKLPGVYLFFSSHSSIPLYIGKSINLRQRIHSHFQNDYLTSKEFTLSQKVEVIEIIPTSGELSALLLESKLIKTRMPIYNRRLRRKKEMLGFCVYKQGAYLSVAITTESINEGRSLLGAFSSMHAAKTKLLDLIKEFNLCPKLCNMEKTKKSCFSFQLKRCKGACVDLEPSSFYNERMEKAFSQYEIKAWPFKNAIAIKEYCPKQNINQFLVFNQWRYLGAFDQETNLKKWQLLEDNEVAHYDTYKILYNFLKQNNPIIIDL